MFETPILFLVFNRPGVTRRVFERIRAIKPKQLFVAADGPRKDRLGEDALCQETRRIVESIDWACDVRTLFRTENLGCRNAVSSAISWFFGEVEQGIILEDDCLPAASFFPFCQELLSRYANDPRIMHISGDNFQKGHKRGAADYYFSIYNHVWGWASWRRAWAHYDVNMTGIKRADIRKLLGSMNKSIHFRHYWENAFLKTAGEEIDTWDYQWTYAIWRRQGLSILPQVNLITNIGFGAEATHTQSDSWTANLPALEINIKSHVDKISCHEDADRYTEAQVYGIKQGVLRYLLFRLQFWLRLRSRFRQMFPGPQR
jgi:hypothetical protein